MASTLSFTPRKVDAYTQDVARLSDRLTARINGAVAEIVGGGGAATARSIAMHTGLPESRVQSLLERSAKVDKPQVAAPVASSRRADQAVELHDIMQAAAPMQAAISDMTTKLQRLSALRDEQTISAERYSLLVPAGLGTLAAGGTLLTIGLGFAGVVITAALAACGVTLIGAAKAYRAHRHQTTKADCKISGEDIQKLIALCGAVPEGDTRAVLTHMLRDFGRLVSFNQPGLMSPVAEATLSHAKEGRAGTIESPAAFAAVGLLKMATGDYSGHQQISWALGEATPGHERSRLSQAVREHAFYGDACLLPIDEHAQHDLAMLLLQSSETS